MIRRREKGNVRGEFEDDSRQLTANRYTRFGGPMHRRPARERRRSRRRDRENTTRLPNRRSTLLTRSSHVALLRGGYPDLPWCCLIAAKYQQETSCSEPTSLRPLQAQKESVPFPSGWHPYCLFMRIYSSHLIGLCPRSPLFVYFFCRLLVGHSPCHSAGDGTSSRAKCTHCLSSGSDCIFTEPTKVCPVPLVSAFLWLSTSFSHRLTRSSETVRSPICNRRILSYL